MRIVFLGFQTWGFVSLQALLESSRDEVVLVVTHPESEHPYERIWDDSVRDLACAAGIPVIESRRAERPDVVDAIAAAEADVILCSDWRTFIPSSVLSLAHHGGVNVHDALLPRYGGFAPVNWAVLNGETESGVTAHVMTDELDLGDIIVQRSTPIAFTDTATDVVRRIFPLVAAVTLESLELLRRDDFRPTPQDRNQATFFHKRNEGDSLVDWTQPPLAVYNLVRAQSDPYPNAFTFHDGKRLRIKRASLPEQAFAGTPGRVFCRVPRGVVVVCGRDGQLRNQGLILEVVQPEGGPEMPASSFFKRLGASLTNAPGIVAPIYEEALTR